MLIKQKAILHLQEITTLRKTLDMLHNNLSTCFFTKGGKRFYILRAIYSISQCDLHLHCFISFGYFLGRHLKSVSSLLEEH